MPRARQYTSDAERQAAYRARRAQEQSAERVLISSRYMMAAPKPETASRWSRWRSLVQSVESTLTVVQAEMQVYHNTRSARWHDSEQAEEFQEQCEVLTEIQEQVREWIANRQE